MSKPPNTPIIPPERISLLNQKTECPSGEFVVYWMQASQRTRYNHALEYALSLANDRNIPLVVFFSLRNDYPEANARHFTFLLQGLRDVSRNLRKRKIAFFAALKNDPRHITLEQLSLRARLVITDRGYTRFQREWRAQEARRIPRAFYQIESDAVVPVQTASDKEEYSAATFRRKILPITKEFLRSIPEIRTRCSSLDFSFPALSLRDPTKTILKKISTNFSVSPSIIFFGGENEAHKHLDQFINHRLLLFHNNRNHPDRDASSNLSPYLHFGHISPIEILLAAKERFPKAKGTETLFEELLVRRELAVNFVFFNPAYDSYQCLPDWAKKTLKKHSRDTREFVYSQKEFEEAKTHDIYWNAAQEEMTLTGKMHGYMRMYWGKKILEWSKTPEEAFSTASALNNRYELDGRDPNGFAGVAWCFGKHDRPWTERPIFGMVRYMNDKGLERKFRIQEYVEKVQRLKKKQP